MNPITLTVAHSPSADPEDWPTMNGWTTQTPGLAVVHITEGPTPEEWAIIHIPSGAFTASAQDPEQAQAIAAGLGLFLNWDQHPDTLMDEGDALAIAATWARLQGAILLGGASLPYPATRVNP